MSEDITEGNNSFEDYYKTDNLEDSELQARLYAEIYYESNIESESGSTNVDPRTIKFVSTTETNVESERMQHEPEKQPLISETVEADSQKTHSTDQSELQVDTLTSREMNPAHTCDNENSEDPSTAQGTEQSKENSSKKRKSAKHTNNVHEQNSVEDHDDTVHSKYNVVSKCEKQKKLLDQETDEAKDRSDSEESIFEVPLPPKPKPLLIDLQDSDEDDSNLGTHKNDLILKKWTNSAETNSRAALVRNCELESQQVGSHQDTSFKSKRSDRSYNKNRVNTDKSSQTSQHDIVLNCTRVQKGTKSISEIKQLARSNKIYQDFINSLSSVNKKSKSTENTNQNSKKMSLQNKTSEIESCNPVNNRKRQCNSEVDKQQKRQCTIQGNNRDVIPQGNSSREKRNTLNEFFEPMSEEMKNYYNSSRGQENFDVGQLQQGMSKDPRLWAILDEDIMPCPSSRQHIRFWNVKCSNCHQQGHRRYDCPTPRSSPCCYMCGMKDHMEPRCPQKMCLTCGHEQDQCPDLWRRYHQTTDMSSAPQDPGNVMKPKRLLYCCNCAKRGHESSTCREYRWSENFPTPAVVTNYTDGPMYTLSNPCAQSSSGFSETSFLPDTREKEASIPQSVIDTHQIIENVKSYTNLNTLSSNIDLSITPSEDAECVLQTEEKPLIYPSVKTNFRQTKVRYISFTSIIYSYGSFHDKTHKDARMILTDLTKYLIRCNRRSTLNSLTNRQINPIFLNILLEKAKLEFEIRIGFHCRIVRLQLIAGKTYIDDLYDLFTYWLDLPDDEKHYGIDVVLPINYKKMFNVLNSRTPQLQKNENTFKKDLNPQSIYSRIVNEKKNLKQYKGKKEYKNIRKKILCLQTKLLKIVNTEYDSHISTFYDVMRRFKSGLGQMSNNNLDAATYLRLILLYNHIFVPHTTKEIGGVLQRIQKNKNNNLQQVLEQQQTPEIRYVPAVCEQENFVYDVRTSSATSCTLQNSNFENSPAINNQQSNEILDEKQNVNNTSLEMSEITNQNYDEVMITQNYLTQDPQITPLNAEPMLVQSENSESNKGQLSISKANIEFNVNKQDINVIGLIPPPYKKKENKTKKDKYHTNTSNLYNMASHLIKKARAFKVPHIMNAADEIERRINDRTIKPKHASTLDKLISLEQNYKKNINTYCKVFKK